MRPKHTKGIFSDDSNFPLFYKIPPDPAADSPEILYNYYQDKIGYLQVQLNKLTLLEHPCQIRLVCAEIIKLRRKSLVLARKYKYLHNRPLKLINQKPCI